MLLLVRRILQGILVILVVVAVSFLIFRYIGDPVVSLVGQEASLTEREALRERLGLNDPIPVQFVNFLGRLLTGNFGVSYQYGIPVITLISERLPATLELSLVSSLLSVGLGLVFGVYCAVFPRSKLTHLVMVTSLIGVSLPTFLVGILLIYVFAVLLGWLPSFGRGEIVDLGWWNTGLLTDSGRRAIILPAVTLGLYNLTLVMRFVRAEMSGVLKTDYIRFARARGLPAWRINFRHGLRNTLPPVINIIGLQLGAIISFAIITETVFQWPGVGQLFLGAVTIVDVPLMSAYLVLVAVMFVLISFLVDILCLMVDPRLRTAQS